MKLNNNKNINNINVIFIIFIILLLCIIYYNYYNEPFETIPIERTKLYGSLFLDKLYEVIVNMTDPDIKYQTKRIELNKYSDILL
jgi:hypothetical protein